MAEQVRPRELEDVLRLEYRSKLLNPRYGQYRGRTRGGQLQGRAEEAEGPLKGPHLGTSRRSTHECVCAVREQTGDSCVRAWCKKEGPRGLMGRGGSTPTGGEQEGKARVKR